MKEFRILIVEDNDLFRETLRGIIQVSFPTLSVAEATDGKEALRQVEIFLPALIFMDIALPGENGLELTRKIKADHPNIIIIVITGHDLPEYREAAFQRGADRFIGKSSLSSTNLKELLATYANA